MNIKNVVYLKLAWLLVMIGWLCGCSFHKPEMHSTDPALLFPKPAQPDGGWTAGASDEPARHDGVITCSGDIARCAGPVVPLEDKDICASMEDQAAMVTCYLNKLAPSREHSIINIPGSGDWIVETPPLTNPTPKLTMRPI